LDQSKSLSGDLNPLAKVYLGDPKNAVFSTKLFKHTNAPVWEQAYEFLCADKAESVVTVKVIDDRDFLKDPVVGYMSIKLQDLLDSKMEAGRDWFPLSNCKSGKIRLSADWKPLNMPGSLHSADKYVPPIGVVRLHLDKATDVKYVVSAFLCYASFTWL
jgi:Ca2+-dependent lipid-binding protein